MYLTAITSPIISPPLGKLNTPAAKESSYHCLESFPINWHKEHRPHSEAICLIISPLHVTRVYLGPGMPQLLQRGKSPGHSYQQKERQILSTVYSYRRRFMNLSWTFF